MLKLRIGFFYQQHKLFIRSTSTIIKTRNFSLLCSKATCSSLKTQVVTAENDILRAKIKVLEEKKFAKHLLRSSSPVLIPSRAFWETFPSSGRSFHDKDGLDKDSYELVYRNKLFNYAFYGQLISECTLMAQLGYGLYHGYNYFLSGEIRAVTQVGPFAVSYDLASLGVITFFTIQTAFLFMAAQKALLRIYHKKDTDEYVFVSLDINPFKSKKVIGKPGGLKSLQSASILVMLLGNFEINDRRYFLRHEHFKTNYHYNRLVYEDYESL